MKVFKKAGELSEELDNLRHKGLSIGFVPTMGALHNGHLSLVENAGKENDIVVVSIFVNPTQFNNPNDLKKYPKTIEQDLALLKSTATKIVFAPTVDEIYPDEKSKESQFEFGHLTTVMESKFRPSHFDGVAIVVKRLFEIVKPNKAYFGQKDIQQFMVINHLNIYYLPELKIRLIKCPIIREEDGLAMSSRNVLLDEAQRKSAALISQTLFEAQNTYKNYTVDQLKKWATDKINLDKNLRVEYFELVSDPDLHAINNWVDAKKIIACVAVNAGNVRLIDNVYIN